MLARPRAGFVPAAELRRRLASRRAVEKKLHLAVQPLSNGFRRRL
jgi:hypothetical protein